MNTKATPVTAGPLFGRPAFWAVLGLVLTGLLCLERAVAAPALLLDMTHANPGSGYPASRFASPQFLAEWGYNGQVVGSIGGIQTFDALVPGLLPEGSPEREWALQRGQKLRQQVKAAHAAGLKCFAGVDLFVLPRALVQRFKTEICDERSRIDIEKPKMQEVFRALLRETFQRVPELDGIVVRTGEVYLHDYPFHAASGNFSEGKMQGGTAIVHGQQSHIAILKILRDEVCEREKKLVLYRTWSFGRESFHESPKYYLAVTEAIPPHTNLIFSIKHQQGDFHQLTPFNPTLMIGQHRQLIEVQCQREAYGKGAHPYYVGQGVIDGWEEYAWMMAPGQARGLRDVITNQLCVGVWTWSRGGGWEGPFIKNELWCELNAYVVAKFAQNPSRNEEELFNEFARERLGLQGEDLKKFRELNLLSTKAVLRGQLTTLGAKIDVWWARDHFFEEPDLSDFVKRGRVEKALAEKADAVAMWQQMERLAAEIKFPDAAIGEFVRTSTSYGRIKYAIVEQAWRIFFAGRAGDASRHYDRETLRAAINRYDALWEEWRTLEKEHPCCASIYKDVGFLGHPGMGAGVNRYRRVLDGNSVAKP